MSQSASVRRYLLVIALCVLVLFVSHGMIIGLEKYFDFTASPYLFVTVAVAAITGLYGGRLGVTACLVSAFICDYLFVEPRYTFFWQQSVAENIHLGLILLQGGFVCAIVAALRVSERKAAGVADRLVAESARLQDKENELTQANKQLLLAKERAEAASLTKSQFVANVSHEIRSPLGAIIGFTEILEDDLTDTTRLQKYVHTVHENAKNLLRLVDDVLDLAKVEEGRLEVESIEFKLSDLVGDVMALMEIKARIKGLNLKLLSLDSPSTRVLSDPTRLRQILVNVIGNAIKFTEAGDVTVRTQIVKVKEALHNIEIFVEDSGLGLSQDQIRHLFEPFAQADASITRRYGGTGLGLCLSRKFARALGGDLVLLGSEPGRGSRFKVSIPTQVVSTPLNVRDPIPTASGLAKIGAEKALLGMSILVVDDAKDLQMLICHFLQLAGAKVYTADSGSEAILQSLRLRPDVVLMDIQLPEMDGYAVTERLRGQQFYNPIIALTAHAMKGERDRCIAAGCNDYLSKPVAPQHLVSVIAAHRRARTLPEQDAPVIAAPHLSQSLSSNGILSEPPI